MSTRRTGILTALLLTAALMCAMPGLWHSVIHADSQRVDESLRPPQRETLTVWLLPGRMEDQKLIRQLCTAFEKQQRGVRIFLRRVTAAELTDPESVLPDAVLFETGGVPIPDKVFMPLANTDSKDASGMYAGVRYAVPLWLEANVLSIPAEWLNQAAPSAPAPSSFFALESPAPAQEDLSIVREAPWAQLLQPGALKMPEGIALQQLLMSCPAKLRETLVSSLLSPAAPSPVPSAGSAWSTSQPISRSSACPVPPVQRAARIETIRMHLNAAEKGEAIFPFLLTPAVSDRVRYAAICRDNSVAALFLDFCKAGEAK